MLWVVTSLIGGHSRSPRPNNNRIHVMVESPWRYTVFPQTLQSMGLLLLYYDQIASVTVPLPSASSDSYIQRSSEIFKTSIQ
jgi:hypothetical protein